MSHLKERKEKICLNCNADLNGRYCHVCGQENLEPKETVWHLIEHFFNDITHFDGKFFETVKYLLRKPGFLSLQYMAGRRASYLNPIRMYVFTSAIFFIVLFSLRGTKEFMKMNETQDKVEKRGLTELGQQKARLEKKLTKPGLDEDDKEDIERDLSLTNLRITSVKNVYGDTTTRKFDNDELDLAVAQNMGDSLKRSDLPKFVKDRISKKVEEKTTGKHDNGPSFFGIYPGQYRSAEAYDSAQQKLPESIRDGWFVRMTTRKLIHLGNEYHEDKRAFKEHFAENILHSFPKILFITLPIFALILNILYFRHKQYYYVNHGIFTIHVYCATFILLLLNILVSKLRDLINMGWFSVICYILMFGIWIYIMIYLYKAMRGFYKQGRGKTFLKYFITCSISFIVNIILFVLFILISAVTL